MAINKKYPYKKIFFLFALIPTAISFLGGAVAGISSFHEWNSAWAFTYYFILITMFYSFAGFIFFSIPAFFAACAYILLRLHKSWYSYLFIVLVSGCLTHFWSVMVYGNRPWNLLGNIDLYFILGAAPSLMVAVIFLPNKPSK